MIRWDPDPVALQLGSTSIRWYTFFFTSGYILGYVLFRRMLLRDKMSLKHLDVLVLLSVVFSIAGARIFHVFFYDWPYFRHHLSEIADVSRGGLASHGGGLGLVAAAWLWTRFLRRDLSTSLVVDLMTVPCALADVLIRVGNFFNSELAGTPTSLPWGVIFVRVDGVPRHPVQLYEALAYLVVFLGLYMTWRRRAEQYIPGNLRLTGFFLLGIFLFRFALEYCKAPTGLTANFGPFSTGQALSLPFVAAGIFLVVRPVRINRQRGHQGPQTQHSAFS